MAGRLIVCPTPIDTGMPVCWVTVARIRRAKAQRSTPAPSLDSSKVARTKASVAARSASMPKLCEPWPGNTKASDAVIQRVFETKRAASMRWSML